jgi:hypothetical protein
MLETRWARKQLATSLESSALMVEVVMIFLGGDVFVEGEEKGEDVGAGAAED